MNIEKQNLIIKAQNGDKGALISLIKSEENNIYSTLYFLKHDDIDISDIVQNVLLKITNKIKTLKNPMYFKTWLNRIILNSYYDYLRLQKRKKETLKKETMYNSSDTAQSLLKNILDKELDLIIKKSIKKLPNHYKIPITLREIQGLSYEDISNITNVSIGTVKSRNARVREIIKDEIIKYQND